MAPKTRPFQLSPSPPLSSPPLTLTHGSDADTLYLRSPSRSRNEESYFPSTVKESSTSRSTETGLTARDITHSLLSPSSGEVSDSETNPWSRVNSIYLTPPEERDYDVPPYKPRRKDSASLTMMEKTKTMPSRGCSSNRKSGYHFQSNVGRKESNTIQQKQSAPWRITNHQAKSSILHSLVNPNTSSQESLNYLGHPLETSRGHQKRLIGLMSDPADPVTTRRWSSVEVGANVPQLGGLESQGSEDDTAKRRSENSVEHQQRILDAAQMILTSRKISVPSLNTPATITLRRASPPSPDRSRRSSIQSLLFSQVDVPHVKEPFENDSLITAYLITSHDIDKITSLIQENILSIKTQKPNMRNNGESPHRSSVQVPRRLSMSTRGLVPDRSSTAETATTITNILGGFPKPSRRRSSQSTITQRDHHSSRQASMFLSRDSIHEIIWEGNGHPRQLSSTGATSSSNSGRHSQEQVFSHDITVWNDNHDKDCTDISPTRHQFFDTTSVIEERLSKSSSNSQSPLSDHKRKFKRYNPFGTTDSPKVESFPALPARKGTNDWISPLPSMHSRGSTPESCSLYSKGIDATQAPESPDDDQSRHLKVVREASRSESSLPLSPSEPLQHHRKSVVLSHPQATHRLSSSSKLGFSLGLSSRVRKPSASKSPKVKIVLPEHRRKKTWKKPRKDSGYPGAGAGAEAEIFDDEQPDVSPTKETSRKIVSQVVKGGHSNPQKLRRDSTHPEIIPMEEGDEEDRTEEERGHYVAPMKNIWSMKVHSPPLTGKKHVGVYASLTGAEGETDEGSDHVRCRDRMSESSIDWIG